jgi:anti-sigma factor RsiW
MTTSEIDEDELQGFVDGELPRGRCTAVLAYLGAHPEEVQRLAQYALQKAELRRRLRALDVPSDDPTTATLQQALADRLTRSRHRMWMPKAAAAALLVGVGWWSSALLAYFLTVPPAVLEAAQAHEVFGDEVRRPVELTATAQAEIVAWFSERLGEPVEIPSLQAIGLRLIGGRLLAGDQGPLAQLIYEDATGYRLTVCLSAEPSDVGPELEMFEVDGLTAGYWQEGELVYAVVAETSEDQLAAIATEIGADASEGNSEPRVDS